MKKLGLLVIPIMSVSLLTGCGNKPTGKDGTIIYGNIITMDETNPTAEAVGFKDGKIIALGSKDEVNEIVKGDVIKKTLTKDDYVYPGFIDTHAHYAIMSNVLAGAAMFNIQEPGRYDVGDYEAYAKEVYKFVQENPNKEVYQGYGLWVADNKKYSPGQTPTAEMLDEFCPTTKPVVVVGSGGHDVWLNTPAIKAYVGDTPEKVNNFINTFGTDCIITDGNITTEYPNGYPTGYFVETARFAITDNLPHTVEQIKDFVRGIQDSTIAKGYTTIGDCSIVESDTNKQVTAFKELNAANELKLKYRSYYEIREYNSKATRDAELQKAIQLAKETKNDDYFQVVGIKVFLDGVYEALSSYTLENYPSEAKKREGYRGIQRWYPNPTNPNEGLDITLKELTYQANKEGLAMEFHAMGDAAVRQALDACEYSNERLMNDGKEAFKNNAISHLGYINSNDLNRFKSLGVTAVVGPQWSPAAKSTLSNEQKCLGDEGAEKMYPIKSIMDTGANVAFHTDGGNVNATEMIYCATTRTTTHIDDIDHVRGENEKITGEDSLKCLTINAAKALNSDSTVGLIKVGLPADFTIYNKDYRDNNVATNLETFKTAKLLGLYVSGVDLLTK